MDIDIIDRKLAENALQESEIKAKELTKRLEAILEAMPSAVGLVDASTTTISYLNNRALELYGFNYTGFHLHEYLSAVHFLKSDETLCTLAELPVSYSLRGQVVRNKELTMVRADGKQIPITVSTSPLFNAQGKIDAAIVIFEDITEIKKNQEALRRSEEILSTITENSCDGINMLNIKTGKLTIIWS